MFDSYNKNTLELYPDKCIGCGMCVNVCPHAVFTMVERKSGGMGLSLPAPNPEDHDADDQAPA